MYQAHGFSLIVLDVYTLVAPTVAPIVTTPQSELVMCLHG